MPCIYLITRLSSSLKISASISFAAYSYKFRQAEHTTTHALIFWTPPQAFMQNSQPVLTTLAMPWISNLFQSSFSGDFQQRYLLSKERQINLGCGYLVLGECLTKRQPFFIWFNTQPIVSLSELSSLLRLVGEEVGLIRVVEVLISAIALLSSCLILEILALVAFILGYGDFILNIL